MKSTTTLTNREYQVTELVAWGAAQKEAADELGISRFTVDNIIRNVKRKLHLQKINEISAWYFCDRFNISMNLSPLKKQLTASVFLALVIIQIGYMDNGQFFRVGRTKTTSSARVRPRTKE